MRRLKLMLGVLALLCAALLSGGQPTAATGAPGPILVTGLDLHGASVLKVGATYEMVGEVYGCGYQWYVPSQWCGFGVSTAPSLAGPWSTPVLLFPPSEMDPYTGQTFDAECGTNDGHGCFEPRLVQNTSDGVWIAYFNVVNGRTSSTTSAIYAMGCNGPAGPCGVGAGAPYGSTHKPVLHQCNGTNGSVALAVDSTGPVIFCSYGNISEERLDYWWTNGTGVGTSNVAVGEGEGAYQDPTTGTWILTTSTQGCGYCAGTSLSYYTAPSLLGPWTTPGNVGQGTWPAGSRAMLTANSCGGQSSTVFNVDGQEYQRIDLWTGSRNETTANTIFEPLTYTGPATGNAGDGQSWKPPFTPWACP